jgi:hypothetical protein
MTVLSGGSFVLDQPLSVLEPEPGDRHEHAMHRTASFSA